MFHAVIGTSSAFYSPLNKAAWQITCGFHAMIITASAQRCRFITFSGATALAEYFCERNGLSGASERLAIAQLLLRDAHVVIVHRT